MEGRYPGRVYVVVVIRNFETLVSAFSTLEKAQRFSNVHPGSRIIRGAVPIDTGYLEVETGEIVNI